MTKLSQFALLTVFWLTLLEHLNYVRCKSLNETLNKVRNKRDAFVCPGDGKWPDETDCGKYHTCQGASETSGWCGPGMSFDTDNQRCEMALAISCKDGDRPDWKPPDNWKGKTKETTTTTKKDAVTTNKSNKPNLPNGVTAKGGESIKENDKCSFKGLMPDKENCATYYYCKESETKKETCNDRQLFDEETKSCKEFKSVYCGERPVNDKSKDVCRSRPNGVYPNLENGCSDFYQCNSQKKIKSGECPNGLKFNLLSLRCDWPSNVPAPCGTKMSNSGSQIKLNIFQFTTPSEFINLKLNLVILLLVNTVISLIFI